jgi:hypothetical protein
VQPEYRCGFRASDVLGLERLPTIGRVGDYGSQDCERVSPLTGLTALNHCARFAPKCSASMNDIPRSLRVTG